MAGFNICGTGGGFGSTFPKANMETRRKYRWVFEDLSTPGGFKFAPNELLILQSAQRPNFKFEEPELHHQQEVAYFAGKQSWEPITMTWYDAENPDVSQALERWFNSVVDWTTANVNPPEEYKGTALLAMVNGFGKRTEEWTLCNCWPKSGNWGDLNYTDTEIATIECEMRYDRAKKTAFAGAENQP